MRKLVFFFSLVIILARLPSAYALDLSKFEHLVVFGDSLSDNGNSFFLFKQPQPPYYNGRWSNGPVWVDYFPRVAKSFGVDISPATAFLQDGQTDNATNFAIGGATSGKGNTFITTPAGLQFEINTYLSAVNDHASANDLYVFWIGANDFLAGIDPAQTVVNIKNAIATLASKGARTFAVIKIPDLALTPLVKSFGGATIQEAKQFVVTANVLLAVELSRLAFAHQIRIELVDINAIFIPLVFSPVLFGFTNSTDSALAALAANPSTNPNDYVFWDGFHPTTKVHLLGAEFIYIVLASKSALPETLPVPLAKVRSLLAR
jgi:phospholipase/lecithinase/hemolysin